MYPFVHTLYNAYEQQMWSTHIVCQRDRTCKRRLSISSSPKYLKVLAQSTFKSTVDGLGRVNNVIQIIYSSIVNSYSICCWWYTRNTVFLIYWYIKLISRGNFKKHSLFIYYNFFSNSRFSFDKIYFKCYWNSQKMSFLNACLVGILSQNSNSE